MHKTLLPTPSFAIFSGMRMQERREWVCVRPLKTQK
jgi:hypothetical protein